MKKKVLSLLLSLTMALSAIPMATATTYAATGSLTDIISGLGDLSSMGSLINGLGDANAAKDLLNKLGTVDSIKDLINKVGDIGSVKELIKKLEALDSSSEVLKKLGNVTSPSDLLNKLTNLKESSELLKKLANLDATGELSKTLGTIDSTLDLVNKLNGTIDSSSDLIKQLGNLGSTNDMFKLVDGLGSVSDFFDKLKGLGVSNNSIGTLIEGDNTLLFYEYRKLAYDTCNDFLKAGDSAAIKALVADAQNKIELLSYDAFQKDSDVINNLLNELEKQIQETRFNDYKGVQVAFCKSLITDKDSVESQILIEQALSKIEGITYAIYAKDNNVIDTIIAELKTEVSEIRRANIKATKVSLTKVKAQKSAKIKLTFKTPDTAEVSFDSYQIYRSTKAGSGFKKVAKVVGEETTYTDSTGLKKGKTYYYKVRGVQKLPNGNNSYSKWSTVKSVKCK